MAMTKLGTLLGTLSVGSLLAAAGCAQRVPFTHQMRSEYNLGADELGRLQYYVAGQIRLQREMSVQEVSVTPGHQLRILRNKRIEEVVIRPGTPGVAVGSSENSVEVSFEKDGSLTFGSSEPNRALLGGRYGLFAEEWRAGEGRVQYAGKTFRLLPESEDIHLLVDLKSLDNCRKDSRTAPGRKLR
jgi:hypothetical protein